MRQVTLYIETPDGQRTFSLQNEISIGRTNLAQMIVNDQTLSRLHATIFREGEDVWILDENSSNGSFVNGERVAPERKLRDGDEILLGSNTRIYVEIAASQSARPENQNTATASFGNSNLSSGAPLSNTPLPPPRPPVAAIQKLPLNGIPLVPLVGAASAFLIIAFAGVAIFLLKDSGDKKQQANKRNSPPVVNTGAVIPVRVIDPLGGEDPDDLDDFLSSWEGEEKELNAADIEEIQVASSSDPSKPRTDLIVSRAFWEQQKAAALSRGRGGEPLIYMPQISGRGFADQLRKGAQLREKGYKVPLDFADLAELRLKGTLEELPIATKSYVLDVGGSATGDPFTEFDFDRGSVPLIPGSEKYNNLKRLADNFDGQKYDLNNPQDRKNMRMRLLRMYNANSRKLLEELCNAYYERFKVPLRITSLVRSMEYQIGLNKINGNSYRVRDKNAIPPHTTGCTFDIGRNWLPNDAQNFLITWLSEHESRGSLDTLIEGNVNACFHTFIYPDGIGPNQMVASQTKPAISTGQKPNAKAVK